MESPIPQLAKPSAETQRYCDLIYVGIFAILGLVFFVKGVGMIGQEQYSVGSCFVKTVGVERLFVKWNVDYELHSHKNQTVIEKLVDDIDTANVWMKKITPGMTQACYERSGKFHWTVSKVYFYAGLFWTSMGILFSFLAFAFFYLTRPESERIIPPQYSESTEIAMNKNV